MQNPARFKTVFPHKPLIGMIHLKALPGSPGYGGTMRDVIAAALADAEILEDNGVDALMIENFFDVPFFKERVGPETVAAVATVTTLIKMRVKLPLGVNILRNDAISALAVAAACGCQFVRVNVLAWAMLADQGVIEGRAAEVLRYRKALDADTLIFADCLVKHAVPLASQPMDLIAMDTWERGGADALVISGTGTGKATEIDDVALARLGAPDAPILLGSGVTADDLPKFWPLIDGALVGTYFKTGGKVANPVDPARVRELITVRDSLRAEAPR